jgi:hypothetical protein
MGSSDEHRPESNPRSWGLTMHNKNIVVFCAVLIICSQLTGCSRDKSQLMRDAQNGDTRAARQLAQLCYKKGDEFQAASWLGTAASAGDESSLMELTNRAAKNEYGAVVTLNSYYAKRGEKRKALDYAYLAAKIEPSLAEPVAESFLFGRCDDVGPDDVARGTECLVLAAESDGGRRTFYILLSRLAQDGKIKASSAAQQNKWDEHASHADDKDFRLLKAILESSDLPKARDYAKTIKDPAQ